MENSSEEAIEQISCKPFLKWAGGKGQILTELISRLPSDFNTYFEPFLGGAALFFKLQPKQAVLSDVNSELINAFNVVKSNVGELMEDLATHVYEEEYYYQTRDVDRTDSFQSWDSVKRASRLIYLNKTCFNGLYRVNSKNQFNVPFGKYSNPKILDADNLKACSKVLKGKKILCKSFEKVLELAKPGDFVYFDPPYYPLSSTSNFTTYSSEGFSPELHKYLYNVCQQLDLKGINFMLSNSSAPVVRELYASFNIEEIHASRAINSKSDKRGPVTELVIRNYK